MRLRFVQGHGVVSRRQAVGAGLSDRQIARRVESGVWEVVYPRVYRATAMPVTPEQRIRAACLATATASVASHQSAAWLWGLLDGPPARAAVTVDAATRTRSHGFDLHRSVDLDWGRVLVHRAIECTDPLRTLVDLASVADGAAIDRSVDVALSKGVVTMSGIEQELDRLSQRGRRGVAPLRERLLQRGYIGAPRPSVLESMTLRLLAHSGIRVLGTEIVVGADREYRLDVVVSEGVALEVDGYVWHSSAEQKTYDEGRRNRIGLQGYALLIYSWTDIVRNGRQVVLQVRQALQNQQRGSGRTALAGTVASQPVAGRLGAGVRLGAGHPWTEQR